MSISTRPFTPGLTLNEALAAAGLTKRKALGNYRYHIQRDGKTIFTGCAYETGDWMKAQGLWS